MSPVELVRVILAGGALRVLPRVGGEEALPVWSVVEDAAAGPGEHVTAQVLAHCAGCVHKHHTVLRSFKGCGYLTDVVHVIVFVAAF